MALAAQIVEGQQPVSALSLIENMNVAAVANTMNKIAQFQAVVQQTLKVDHDYGVIPGTHKPTLLKPGAEKILMLMGLTSAYEVTESVRDYEQGFFAFTVTCRLSRNGYAITEGVGHCNTRERRYQGEKQDPYTLANTVLKMAKKRALVDAALTVASLSDIFTQDMEDIVDRSGQNGGTTQARPQRPASNGPKATEKQLQFLDKVAGEKGVRPDMLDDYCMATVGKRVDELTKKDASEVIDSLKNYTPPVREEAASAERDDPFADGEDLPDDADLPF